MPSSPSQSWTFQSPTRVQFGLGARAALAPLLAGKSVLIVTTTRGRRQFSADPVLGPIAASNIVTWVDSVTPNPGLAQTQAQIDRLVGQRFDAVVAFGGGSAMDAAKALAAALTPGLATRDLATLIAAPAQYLTGPLLPVHALPTTSGTGSEVTPFATVWDHARKKKLSLASPALFPATAIVDPQLTYGLPAAATLSTSLDALNQAFESLWNRNRSPLTTLMAARAIGLALDAIPRLHADLTDHAARVLIAESSLMAGLCISQTRTAICHSISYPLTAHFGLDHGFACAFTMRAVADLCLDGAPEGLEAAAQLSGHGSARRLVAALREVLAVVDLDRATAILPDRAALCALADEMTTPGRSDNFILPINDATLRSILEAS